MYDRFNRNINYLRISVTDRCNLRCSYCMPVDGIQLLRHADILTFDEITNFTKVAVKNGVNKVRITGGEPLCHPHWLEILQAACSLGFRSVALQTNAMLLRDEQLAALRELDFAGLKDMGWEVSSVTAVPIPAAAWLFLSGLAGLFGFARRRMA